MKISIVCHRFYPHFGGTERVAELQARGLAGLGHQVTVWTSTEPEWNRDRDPDRRSDSGFQQDGPWSVRHLPTVYVPIGPSRSPLRIVRWWPPEVWHEADVVHIHGYRVWCSDMYLPFAGGCPAVQFIQPHGFWALSHRNSFSDRAHFRWWTHALRAIPNYLALTDLEVDQVSRTGYAGRFYPLTTPVSPVRAVPRTSEPHRPVALYVGGFEPNKRVQLLTESMPDGWNLRIAGRLSRAELEQAYADCDVVVLASDYEGFALTPVEGMSGGKPFVSTAVGQCPSWAQEGAGFVVPIEAGEFRKQFPEALRRLEDPETYAACSRAGRQIAARYDPNESARKLALLYQQAGA